MKPKTLIVTIRSEDIDKDTVEGIKNSLKLSLPSHEVAVLAVGCEDDVQIHEFANSNYKEES